MAKTIAWCHGYDKSRIKSASRLGAKTAKAEANTFHTFAEVCTHADGSGYATVTRDGKVLLYFPYDPEGE